MAGIGFQLRRLQKKETISAIVASAGHAAMIAAGPWLFTIIALASITLTAERIAGLDVLANFRAIVIYAFASSLVLSAPAVMVTTRLIGDYLWLKQPEKIRPLLIGGLVVVVAAVGAGVAAMLAFFRLSPGPSLVLAAMSLVVALIWITITFCGAVRDYRGVTLSFLTGLAFAMLATIGVSILGFEAVGMAWAFTAGLTITWIGLVSRVVATFPHPVRDPLEGARAILQAFGPYWSIALGALLGTMGVWIDKWVFWLSPAGEAVESGLLHSPRYDSSMFIASLLLIPALSSFVTNLETGFFERYQQYYATIGSHGTLSQIETARVRLARYTMESLALISVTLVGLAGIVLLTAPIIVDALAMQFRQIAVLRYGAIGAVFQFVFIAASSMLLFFDRKRRYLYVQAVYLVLNAGFAALSLRLGEDFYGAGYFVANLIGALIAYRMIERTFARLNYLTFIGNNPSIIARAGN
jgi:uncharacterized membrane protein